MRRKVFSRLLSYLPQHKGLLLLGILSALASVLLSLMGPVFIGRAVDAIASPQGVDFEQTVFELVRFGLSIAGAAIAQWIMQVTTRKVSALISQEMRESAFRKINEVLLERIDTQRHGDIVSRLVNDVDAVSEGLLQGLSQLLPGATTIVATIVVMLVLNVPIALAVILVTPLSVLFARFVARRSGAYFRKQSAALGSISGLVGEMVANHVVVQAYGYEQEAQRQYEVANQKYFETNFKATFYSSIINPGTRLVNAMVYGAVGMLGALYAIGGGITVGGLSAFLSYANQYTKPFNEISAVLTQMQGAIASAGRLFEIMDWPSQQEDSPDALMPGHSDGNVIADSVYFSYTKEKPLIQDFNMRATTGQRIALVGPTGCGKTTIINLLMRFYEIDSGSIRVDCNPIHMVSRDSLRGFYGMVLQDTWLKQATVRENIAYGRPDASQDEIVAAAKSALAHGFIKRLPQGYDTVIDSGGGNLSAGQRQLLCIARIMLSRPDMLLLDEATSSIDTRTELLVQQALGKLMHGRTSFIVAHRLSTIQNADQILVMDAGRIVERGSHDVLLKKGGFYKQLYENQFAVQDMSEN